MKRWGMSLLAAGAALAAASSTRAAEYCVECAAPAATYRCAADPTGFAGTSPQLQLLCASELARLGGHESCSVRRQSSAPCDGPLKTVTAPDDGVGPAPAGSATANGSPPPTRDVPRPIDGSQPPPSQPGATARTSPAGSPAGATPGTSVYVPPPAPPQYGAAYPPPAAPVPAPVPAPANEPPRTVEEAAKGLVNSSSKGLQTAGSAVAETTEQTAGAVTGTAKSAGNMVIDGAKSAGNAVGKAGAAVGQAAKKSWHCVVSLFSDC